MSLSWRWRGRALRCSPPHAGAAERPAGARPQGALSTQQEFGLNSKCRGEPLEKFKCRVRRADLQVVKNHSSARKA